MIVLLLNTDHGSRLVMTPLDRRGNWLLGKMVFRLIVKDNSIKYLIFCLCILLPVTTVCIVYIIFSIVYTVLQVFYLLKGSFFPCHCHRVECLFLVGTVGSL